MLHLTSNNHHKLMLIYRNMTYIINTTFISIYYVRQVKKHIVKNHGYRKLLDKKYVGTCTYVQ